MNESIHHQVQSLRDLIGPNRVRDIANAFETVEIKIKDVYKLAKPWKLFFTDLRTPSQWDRKNLESRICTNLLYFRSNYFTVVSCFMLLGIVFNPIIILSLIIVAAWYIYVMLIMKGPLMVGDYEVDFHMRLVICSISAIVFFALTGALEAVLWSLFYGIVACLVHLMLRSKNHSQLTSPAQEDIKLALYVIYNGADLDEASSSSNSANAEYDIESIVHKENVAVRRKSNPDVGHHTK